MNHGTRSYYQQAGCRCLPCRAAEAAYRAGLRRRHLKGLPILGELVDAEPSKRMLRVIRGEYFGKHATILAFGYAQPYLQWGRKIRRSTANRVERFYQQALGLERDDLEAAG